MSGAPASGPVVHLGPDAEGSDLSAAVDALRQESPDHATVIVTADSAGARGLWRRLASALDGLKQDGVTAVRLVWAGAGADLPDRPAPARRICEDWQVHVLAPAGPVVVAPGGALFAPPGPDGAGGWWRFSPGLHARPLGLRHPVPSWEDAALHLTSEAVAGYAVEPIPAGVHIRRAEPLPDTGQAVGASIPVDGQRLALVVGVPGTAPVGAEALTELLTRLPPRARHATRLIPGDARDLLPTGQETADLLGAEVEIVSGVPALLESADGTAKEAVVLITADGEPSWRPYAEAVACLPGRGGHAPAPRIVQWRSPLTGVPDASADGVLPLGDMWQVAVTRAGLWVGPREDTRPGGLGWSLDPQTMMIDVGVPGRELDDGLWPVLDGFLGKLEPTAVAQATLHVRGVCTAQGKRQIRRIAERHQLLLAHDEKTSEERTETGARATAPEAQQARNKASAAAGGDASTEVPWHASPMSVRIRHVPAPVPAASENPASGNPAAPAAPPTRSASTPGTPPVSSTSGAGVHTTPSAPVSAAPTTPAPRGALPPGFAEAFAASRSVGKPLGRSVPVSWSTPGATSAQEPAGNPSSPGRPAGQATADPVAPVGPSSEEAAHSPRPSSPPGPPRPVAPVRPPAADPLPVPDTSVSVTATPVRRSAPPFPVGPMHRSGPTERQALRALAGERWWQQQSAVTSTLTVMPGGKDQNDAVLADLIAVRSYLTLDEGPLSRPWLEQQLAAGSADAYPCLACQASGLRRLPSYRGIVVRDAGTLSSRAKALPPGTELSEQGPVSAFVLEGAPAATGDRYLIRSVTGRRVRSLTAPVTQGQQSEEIVFGPGTRFRVLGSVDRPDVTTVLLSEVAAGSPAARQGTQDALDRDAREQLVQALDQLPGTAATVPWPARLSGPLTEHVPHRDTDT
ncbi:MULTISPECIES: hypothetical protein [Streptomyces]|uniref:hypothetical protein n=1 Tax=Streptomyces TaxID=1883 RepID=UPI001675225F|nr:hypothetical protein [Streptomyces canarius]